MAAARLYRDVRILRSRNVVVGWRRPEPTEVSPPQALEARETSPAEATDRDVGGRAKEIGVRLNAPWTAPHPGDLSTHRGLTSARGGRMMEGWAHKAAPCRRM